MAGQRLELSSPLSFATVIPAEGGRVQNVVDRTSGRDLLMQRTRAPGPRADYLASCAGGWDELFPNDSAWRDYPDHGMIWTLRFAVTSATGDRVELAARIAVPDVKVVRTVSLLEAPRRGVRSEVTLSAIAATGPFLWAAHPMLGVGEGWTIELPSSARNLEADPDLPGRFGSGMVLSRSAWEERATRIPPVSSGVAELVYVDGVSEALVHSSDGRATTRVSWDPGFYHHLWIVVITGAYGLDDCLIFEPCTTRPYRLDDAISAGTARQLEAGTEKSWWVEVESLDR